MAPSPFPKPPDDPSRPSSFAASLLNPKAASKHANKNQRQPSGAKSSSKGNGISSALFNGADITVVDLDADDEQNDGGMASMIEKLHNVEKREGHPPLKKKKTHHSFDGSNDDDGEEVEVKEKNKSTFSGKIGGDSSYKNHTANLDKQLDEGTTSSSVVDLTGDDDLDDVVALKHTQKMDNKRAEEVVCLGRIENARVNAFMVPFPKMNVGFQITKTWPAIPCTFSRRPGQTSVISVTDACGKDFGNIDPRVAPALSTLMDGQRTTKFSLQGKLDVRKKGEFEHAGQAISSSLPISINVYAARRSVSGIGRWLSQHQVYLRDPIAVKQGIEIVNPHTPKDFSGGTEDRSRDLVASTSKKVQITYHTRTAEEIKSDVTNLLNSLKDTSQLPEKEPDSHVTTPLLRHQKQALYFLTEREKNRNAKTDKAEEQMWQERTRPNGTKVWYNVITGQEARDEPEPNRGGILADVMGLGKTLAMLSLIVALRKEAVTFHSTKPGEDTKATVNSRATLVVCPLSTVVNWEEQIKIHLKHKAVRYCVYHGPNRSTDILELRDYDIVVSTYSTVSADFDRRSRKRISSPLAEIQWFRIVLDEAHMIRDQTTRQSLAICDLSADRRWCVTGTPVQNRLDDLGALIKFLRIKPFDDKATFAHYITVPLRGGDVDAIGRLRVLVDSITLRRPKDRIDLPERVEEVAELEMTHSERALYMTFHQDSREKFRAMVGDKSKLAGQAMAHILKAILRMRLLCAHGGELLSEEDWQLAKGFSASHAIDLENEDDEVPDRTAKQAYEMYRMMRDANMHFCSKCSNQIQPPELVSDDEDESDGPSKDNSAFNTDAEDDNASDGERAFGYLTPCNQLLCPKCFPAFERDFKRNPDTGEDNYGKCPLCDTYIRVVFFKLLPSAFAAEERALEAMRLNPRLAKHSGRYSGPHTKTRALLQRLREDAAISAANPSERPIKSVVFSVWTSHLDLIQLALSDAEIPYTRLDGSMSRRARNEALNLLDNDPSIPVILVSLNAGGLGLNLTTASRVYMMEPQWNPAAEAQAIERVHRLGQERDVRITKFIMANSFEEEIVRLQKKKIELAKMSLEKDGDDGGVMGLGASANKLQNAAKRLEDLRQLFR